MIHFHHITIYISKKINKPLFCNFLDLQESIISSQGEGIILNWNKKLISSPYSEPKATTQFTSQLPPPVKSMKTLASA